MKRILLAFLLLTLLVNPVYGAISPSYPYTLQNGTTADASQVMGNFNQIQGDVNSYAAHNGANVDITSLTGLTTPLALAYGGTPVYVGGTSGGSANAQTLLVVSPTSFALVAGFMVTGIAGYSNSSTATLAVNGLSAKAIEKGTSAGLAVLAGGEIVAGNPYLFYYDGTQFEVLNPTLSSALVTGPGSATASDIVTFNGTTGKIIQDSGLTATSFIRKVATQTFTSSGTYTPTTGMVYCLIQAVGGGAGGGAYSSGSVAAGGGGSGEFAEGLFTAATIGSSQTVTIGTAGAGGTSGATGSNGGITSVGSIITAAGGSGGVGSASASTHVARGGLGGTGGSGGDIRTPGQAGFSSAFNSDLAGQGGSTQFGAGGLAGDLDTPAPGAGLGYGAGGGGAGQSGTTSGGAGTKGMVYITEYLNQ